MRRSPLLLALALSGCLSTGFDEALAPPVSLMRAAANGPRVTSWVDDAHHEVVVLAGPFEVPASMDMAGGHSHGEGHDGAMRSPLIPLIWPVEGGLQGFRLAATTSDGTPLPRSIMHHMIAVNFERRQLLYPVPERIFGFGTETPDVRLPDFMEVPLQPGDTVGMYAMWNNTTGQDLHDVYMQVVLPYATGVRTREAVMPIYMDTNNHIGGKTSFDLPPGRSVRSYEFQLPIGGGLLAAGGHLHDYGVELRLEDAVSGRVLVRLESERGADGHVEGVTQKIFRRFFNLLDARIALEPGHTYRVVGVYDNPTGKVIPDGGMAHIVGLFAPDDPSRWPALDRGSAPYLKDVAMLPPPSIGGRIQRR